MKGRLRRTNLRRRKWPRQSTRPQEPRRKTISTSAISSPPQPLAKAEYEVIKKASDKAPGSVPPERLDELLLKCKEYDLAVEKARLDQRIATEEAKIARAEFEATKLPDDRKAQADLDVAKAEARYNVAKAKAEDDINVRYAIAAAEVAKAEYEVNKMANDHVSGSVSTERLNELRLRVTVADLAVEKAKHEQQVAARAANVAKAEFEKAKGRPLISDKQKVVTNPNFTGGSSCC